MRFRCDTFVHVRGEREISNSMSFCDQNWVITFGGLTLQIGTKLQYVYCSFDLNVTIPHKSGHSIVTTLLSGLATVPTPSALIRW